MILYQVARFRRQCYWDELAETCGGISRMAAFRGVVGFRKSVVIEPALVVPTLKLNYTHILPHSEINSTHRNCSMRYVHPCLTHSANFSPNVPVLDNLVTSVYPAFPGVVPRLHPRGGKRLMGHWSIFRSCAPSCDCMCASTNLYK